MGQNPCKQKGGDITTIIGIQLLWLGPLILIPELPQLLYQLHWFLVHQFYYPSDPYFEFFNSLGRAILHVGVGTVLTVIGGVCLAHWIRLYRRDLAWERKMGYHGR